MTNQWPALVVTSGPQAGQCFTVRSDHASVGRGADADIRVESYNVSRQHLRVSRRGAELLVRDLGSSNGTYVNGTRLAGVGVLKPGDTLRVADVELQYVVLGAPTRAGAAPSSRSYDFGDVSGPVNTGDPVNHGGNQVVGSGSIHHGNVHHGDRYDVEAGLDNGFQELFSGRGPGRVLMAIGLIVAIAGFGIWMSIIFSGMTSGGPTAPSPFEKDILGLNAAVTGFAMFGAGGLLMAVGAGMSKAARQREERRHR